MILEDARKKLIKILRDLNFLSESVMIRAKVLSAREAIGNPEEYDFPLLKGKEKIVEANFRGHLGHAFTDTYGGFSGSLYQVFSMPGSNNYRRALQVATINAVCRFLGEVKDTVHCRDQQPKECARRSALWLQEQYPDIKKIALIGFQPAFADFLSKEYQLSILDLDPENIGKKVFGQQILSGTTDSLKVIRWADLVLSTGSTVVNGSIDEIIRAAGSKPVMFYGVTIAGVAWLLDLKRLCFIKDLL